MTKTKTAMLRVFLGVCAGTLAFGQTSPGHVNFFANANTDYNTYTYAPSGSVQQWFNQNIAGMTVFSPYFDSRTWWYKNGYVYQDLYEIEPGSWEQANHPEWVLKDGNGRWLYIPYACGGGTCPMYAGDIANGNFRSYWISRMAGIMRSGGYNAMWLDDVNMEFRVSDGFGNQVVPIDTNTGQPMTYDAWRWYIGEFTAEIRAAFPNAKIMHNAIWFADSGGAWASDGAIEREIQSADYVNLERGLASDQGLSGGTGFWSIYNFFNYIDHIHALGRGVDLQAYQLNNYQQQYNLATYYMISTGNDFVTDFNSNPYGWWSGYNTELGYPLGARTYSNGVFQRKFSNGMALVGEPGLGTRWVDLGGSYQTLDGNWVNGVNISGSQGIVLLGSNGATAAAPAPAPAPAPTAPSAPASTGGVQHYVSDLTWTYNVNGWGDTHLNVSTNGNPLTINGVTFASGLGVHAYSEQRYQLNGNCSNFSSAVGIDGEVPPGYGNVDFQLWGDGRLIYNSGFLQSGSPTAYANVDVSGVQSISLVVTNGIWMAPFWTTPLDHSDWGNAILTCAN